MGWCSNLRGLLAVTRVRQQLCAGHVPRANNFRKPSTHPPTMTYASSLPRTPPFGFPIPQLNHPAPSTHHAAMASESSFPRNSSRFCRTPSRGVRCATITTRY